MKKHIPIRMCIGCREKIAQKELSRLQKNNKEVTLYSGIGRSFYICNNCIASNKHLVKRVCGIMKLNEESFLRVLKELKDNVKN